MLTRVSESEEETITSVLTRVSESEEGMITSVLSARQCGDIAKEDKMLIPGVQV